MVTNNGHNFSEITYCGLIIATVIACIQFASGEHTASNVDYPDIGNLVSWVGKKSRHESDVSHREELYDTVERRRNSNDFNHLNTKFNNFIKDEYVEEDNYNDEARIQPRNLVNSKNREIGVGPLKFIQDSDVDDNRYHRNNNNRYSSLTSSFGEGGLPPHNYCFNNNNNQAFINNNVKPLMASKSNYKEQSKPNEFLKDERIIQKNFLQNSQVPNEQQVPSQTQKGNIFYRYLPEIAQKEKTDESTQNPPSESNFNTDLQANKNKKFGIQEFPKNENTDDNWGIKNIFKPKSECLEIIENERKNEYLQSHTNDIKSNSESIKMLNVRPQNGNIQNYGNNIRQQSENLKYRNLPPTNENIHAYANNIRMKNENLKPENIRPQNENVQSYGKDFRSQPEKLKLRPPNENIQGNVNNIRLRSESLKPENIRPQNVNIQSYGRDNQRLQSENLRTTNENIQGYINNIRLKNENFNPENIRLQNENIQSYGKVIRIQPENFKFGNTGQQNENIQSNSRYIGMNSENVKLGNIKSQSDYIQNNPRSKSEPRNEKVFNYARSYADDFKIPQDVNIQSHVSAKSEHLQIPQNDDSVKHIEHFLSNGEFSRDDHNLNNYQGNRINAIKNRHGDEIVKTALKQTDYSKINTKINKISERLVPNRNFEPFDAAHNSWDGNRISELGQILNETNADIKEKINKNFEDSEYYDEEEKDKLSNNFIKHNYDTYKNGLNPEQLNSKLSGCSNGYIENTDEINKHDDMNGFVQNEPLVQKIFNDNNNVHISPQSVEQNLELEDDASLNEDYKGRATTEHWEIAKIFNTPLDRGYEDKQAILSHEVGRLERSDNNTVTEKNVSSDEKVKEAIGIALGHSIEHNNGTRYKTALISTLQPTKNDYPSIFAIPTPMSMLPAGAVNPNGSNTNLSISCGCVTPTSRCSSLSNTYKALIGNNSNESIKNVFGNQYKVTATTVPNPMVAEAIIDSVESKEAKDRAVDSIETVITDNPLKTRPKSSRNKEALSNNNISSLNNSDKKSDNSSLIKNVKLNTVNSENNIQNSSDINKKALSKSEVVSKNKSGKSTSNTKNTSNNEASIKRNKGNKNNEEDKKEVGIEDNSKERKQDEEIEAEKPYSQWMDIDYDDRNRRGINCGCFPVNEEEINTNMVSEDSDEENDEGFYSLMNKNHPKSFISRTYNNWMAEREGRELLGKSRASKTPQSKTDNFKGNYGNVLFRPMKLDDPELALIRHEDEPPARNDQSNRGSDLFNYDDNADAEKVPLVTHTPIKHVKWHNFSDGSNRVFASNTQNM
ncbi:hypothetical protein O3M35_006607 [Rhynocoris fuscipes]|uniref:Uncharacterized protein n=1 Tax=Rhynocoris fuscipes TaxID=488301 RepID=A0AAW1DFS0_9HEMI